MPTVRYQNYKLSSASGEDVLNIADFSQTTDVKQEHVRFLLTDLHGFTTQGLQAEFKSRLELSIDGQNLSISKDYQSGQVGAEPAGADLQWTNGFVLVPRGLGADLDLQLRHLVASSSSGGGVDSTNIKSELLALGDENIAKILELNGKISALDSQLGGQKRKDEITLSLGEIEKELADAEERIASVGDLVTKKDNIDATLAKFGEMVQKDLEGESVKLREQLTALRRQQLDEVVAGSKVIMPAGAESEDLVSKRHGIWGVPLLGMMVISIVASIVAYLLKNNPALIVTGVAAAVVQLIIFVLINMLPLSVSISLVNKQGTPSLAGKNPEVDGKWKAALHQIESFFVGKAWVNALKSESEEVGAMVSKRLDGQSIADLENAKKLLGQNVANLRQEVDKLADAEIPPQEYLEKRRELDMLKLDKTRVERDLRAREDYETIADKLASLGSEEVASVELPEDIAGALGVGSVEASQDEIVTTPTAFGELTDQQKYLLVQWLRIAQWQQDPQSPLVIVDNLTNKQENIKLVLQKRLADLHNVGQIVLINLLP
ncbi:hypothetical protein KC640_00905 [Candidatus Dojkabacteria bacterium]|uniref:Uncharacterized protein n=1 Tax=Candidatus Dojkabacteria bacterium TaxID=2099670 RepID=A0A955KZD8_9BACT|nr:hypothetical protein [Candidatus Dojkabacteria bacterium]